MTPRDAIFPEGAARHALYHEHGYSPAIRSGGLLFVSGQVGSRPDGTLEATHLAQVERAFDNLAAILAAAGCGFDDVIDVTTMHTDPAAQFGDLMAVKARHFPTAPHPAWTAIGVTWLAGFDFEIKVVARIPDAAA
ncbi:RidA family protein [Paracoccus sp. ME4]|uniref:RidA family protein n=1 Tax=Paracoccus sp. ME4 TaxID=3138066 RepID=UPI00398B137F